MGLRVENGRLAILKAETEQALLQMQSERDEALKRPEQVIDKELTVNQRAQIELNQIIQRKLGEFRSITSTRGASTKREADFAMKIDSVTQELTQLKGVQQENKTLAQENQIMKHQLGYLKLQL